MPVHGLCFVSKPPPAERQRNTIEILTDELAGFAKIDRPPESMHAPVLAEFDL